MSKRACRSGKFVREETLTAGCYAPTIPLIRAMFADVADYSEWTTGRRTTGVI